MGIEEILMKTYVENKLYQRYKSIKDPDKKVLLLAEYLRGEREYALMRVKDEFIAMKSEPEYYRRRQYNIFQKYNIFQRDFYGAYDYLREIREFAKKKDRL